MHPDRFTRHDFDELSALVLVTRDTARDLDWSRPAGPVEWSCLRTAEHVVDCVFSYALFLGSAKQDAYPRFGELEALPGAGPADMIDGLHASDIASGLGIAFEPPPELCGRLFRATTRWPGNLEIAPGDDPWHDLRARSGR
jgi:hypothetical protein